MKNSGNRYPQQKPQVSVTHQQLYCGPVPDPESLAKYEQIEPGFANRLLTMAEKEQDKRQLQQDKIIEHEGEIYRLDSRNLKRGQCFALISVILVVALCAFGFHLKYSTESRDIGVAVIAAVAGVFVTGKLFSRRSQNHSKN